MWYEFVLLIRVPCFTYNNNQLNRACKLNESLRLVPTMSTYALAPSPQRHFMAFSSTFKQAGSSSIHLKNPQLLPHPLGQPWYLLPLLGPSFFTVILIKIYRFCFLLTLEISTLTYTSFKNVRSLHIIRFQRFQDFYFCTHRRSWYVLELGTRTTKQFSHNSQFHT